MKGDGTRPTSQISCIRLLPTDLSPRPASESRIRPQEHLIEMLRSAELPGQGSAAVLAKQHILFSLRHAKYLPTPYQAEDNNRCVPEPANPGRKAHDKIEICLY